jgi:hypothetical protein
MNELAIVIGIVIMAVGLVGLLLTTINLPCTTILTPSAYQLPTLFFICLTIAGLITAHNGLKPDKVKS